MGDTFVWDYFETEWVVPVEGPFSVLYSQLQNEWNGAEYDWCLFGKTFG